MPDNNLTSTLPAIRCSEGQRQQIETVAGRLAISTAELIRACVDHCLSQIPSPESRLIVRSSRKIAQESQSD